jgi:hypothetical protein
LHDPQKVGGHCVYSNAGVGISEQKCKSEYTVVHPQVDPLYSFAEVGIGEEKCHGERM